MGNEGFFSCRCCCCCCLFHFWLFVACTHNSHDEFSSSCIHHTAELNTKIRIAIFAKCKLFKGKKESKRRQNKITLAAAVVVVSCLSLFICTRWVQLRLHFIFIMFFSLSLSLLAHSFLSFHFVCCWAVRCKLLRERECKYFSLNSTFFNSVFSYFSPLFFSFLSVCIHICVLFVLRKLLVRLFWACVSARGCSPPRCTL